MTSEKKEKPNPTILLMFVGRCILSDGKSEGRIYYQVKGDFKAGVLPDRPVEHIFGAKDVGSLMGGSAGVIYRVETPLGDPTQLYSATAKYEGQWPDREQRAAWQMQDQTMGQKLALVKEHKKAKRDDAVLECLEPIREAYKRARGLQRNLLLARAVQYITKG